VISKHGKPLVKLVPHEWDTGPRDMSVRIWEGKVRMAEDFDELPKESAEPFTK
jgi:antitoxin (DNA-binding transcriptional repressor) of toxin-antitoxin stability system